MGQDLRTDADLVAAHDALLSRASPTSSGCRSLALPAFGTGVGGFRSASAPRIMVEEARTFEPRSLERVIFAVFGARGLRGVLVRALLA